MSVFTHLSDPDSLQGVVVMSHIYTNTSNPMHRILEFELTDNWVSALLEYGLIHNSQQYNQALQYYILQNSAMNTTTTTSSSNSNTTSATSSIIKNETSGVSLADTIPVVSLRDTIPKTVSFEHQQQCIDSTTTATTSSTCSMPLSEVVELQRRKLHCMIELGHFEAVIDQVGGSM